MKEKKRTEERLAKIKDVLKNRIGNIRIGIYDVFKEHNISAILRTAEFFGYQYIDVIGDLFYDNGIPLNKKVTRGVEKWLTLNYFKSSMNYIDFLRKNNYKIYVTYLDKNAEDYRSINYTEKISIIFGNEFNGITDKYLIEKCDGLIYIPQRGFVQSLNVSVSVGVILSTVINLYENKLDSLGKKEFNKMENLWKTL